MGKERKCKFNSRKERARGQDQVRKIKKWFKKRVLFETFG